MDAKEKEGKYVNDMKCYSNWDRRRRAFINIDVQVDVLGIPPSLPARNCYRVTGDLSRVNELSNGFLDTSR